ncbi:pilus assembly protein [Vibrio parahaemolyticus]|nr:pilus assembly protein [Vibrio parahaemolyticus]
MKYKVLTNLFSLTLLLVSGSSYAIAVSSLFEVSDTNGVGEVKILNNDGKDMFIKMTMSEVEYIDGEKVVKPLDKNNLKDWKLILTPPQVILKPEQQKTIKFHYLCENKDSNGECVTDKDHIYAVDMSPVPYSEGQESSVAIAFGYRTYFLIPATKLDISYDLNRKGSDKFEFDNKSNTMLTVVLNSCKTKFKNECIYQYRVLPGSKKEFPFPKDFVGKEKVEGVIINANEKYHKKFSL